jgi:pimeloyl-ACP methyl ester carboxylesterase
MLTNPKAGVQPIDLFMFHAAATGPRSLDAIKRQLDHSRLNIVTPNLTVHHDIKTSRIKTHLVDICGHLEHQRLSQTIFFGHSMGGFLALLVANEMNKKDNPPRAVILYEPIVHGVLELDNDSDKSVLDWDRQIVEQIQLDFSSGNIKSGLSRFVSAWNEQQFDDLPLAAQETLLNDAENLLKDVLELPHISLTLEDIESINSPIISIVGENSPAFCQRVSHNLMKAQNTTVHSLIGCGHMGPIYQPELVSGFIQSFIKE